MTALTLYPEQLTADRLTARCPHGDSYPKPGYFVALDTADHGCFYARIDSVSPDPTLADTLYLSLTPVAGSPDLQITGARQISPLEFFETYLAMQRPASTSSQAIPLQLGGATLDFNQSGNVVCIQPDALDLQEQILNQLTHLEAPVYILDPIGWAADLSGYSTLRMGQDVQLSLQEIGISTFTRWMIETLPLPVQSQSSELLLSLIPPTPDFIPLQYFVDHPQLQQHPLAAALLHQLYRFHKAQLLASPGGSCVYGLRTTPCHHHRFIRTALGYAGPGL